MTHTRKPTPEPVISTEVPSKFQTVIDTVLERYDADFFTDGGCGVLAALMAEVAIRDKEHGEFNMIMREDIDECQWLSHIVFVHTESRADIDIGGNNAEERWIDKITEEEVEEGTDPDDLCFYNESQDVDPGHDIMGMLVSMTEKYDLNVNTTWVRDNYPGLRKRVIAAIERNRKSDLTPG